jgi:hypothetical protein
LDVDVGTRIKMLNAPNLLSVAAPTGAANHHNEFEHSLAPLRAADWRSKQTLSQLERAINRQIVPNLFRATGLV